MTDHRKATTVSVVEQCGRIAIRTADEKDYHVQHILLSDEQAVMIGTRLYQMGRARIAGRNQ